MHHLGAVLIAFASLTAVVEAAPACLPASAGLPGDERPGSSGLQLGTLAGVPIVCAIRDGKSLGCWDIDAKSGKLTKRAIRAVPGRSIDVEPDAKRCVDGYCLPTTGPAPERVMIATSTDGQHAVIGGPSWTAVFDANTKKLLRTFEYSGDTDGTIIGNAVVGILYIGNMLYLRGADAGPYEAVFASRDDGTRLGHLSDGTREAFSIYEGSASALDAERLAVTDPWFQHLVIFSAKDNSRTVIKRPFALGTCTQEDLDSADSPSGTCAKHFAKAFAPYSGAEVVALRNGQLMIALAGKSIGELAILDGSTLVEQRRLRMPCCRK